MACKANDEGCSITVLPDWGKLMIEECIACDGERKCSSHSIQEAKTERGQEIRHFEVTNYNASNWLPPIAKVSIFFNVEYN